MVELTVQLVQMVDLEVEEVLTIHLEVLDLVILHLLVHRKEIQVVLQVMLQLIMEWGEVVEQPLLEEQEVLLLEVTVEQVQQQVLVEVQQLMLAVVVHQFIKAEQVEQVEQVVEEMVQLADQLLIKQMEQPAQLTLAVVEVVEKDVFQQDR